MAEIHIDEINSYAHFDCNHTLMSDGNSFYCLNCKERFSRFEVEQQEAESLAKALKEIAG